MPVSRRILWIDDDIVGILAPLKRLLERAGLSIDVAYDVSAATEFLRAEKYDVVMLDMLIPSDTSRFSGLGGLELLREMKETRNRDTPVIGLSVVSAAELGPDRARFAAYFDKSELLGKNALAELIETLKHSA